MYQVINQTEEEKFKMYSKLSKKELIKMLIEANRCLGFHQPRIINTNLTVGDLCSCNPRNGGSGICGCTIANNPIDNSQFEYGYL